MMKPADRLIIVHQDPELSLAYPDGTERLLSTDGRVLEEEPERGFVGATAEWKGRNRRGRGGI